MAIETGKIDLSVSDLLQRLSQALYERPNVAVRELLQNGHDAVVFHRLSLSDQEQAHYRGEIEVNLEAVKGKRCLSVIDNGVGMNRDEMENELSVVGRSKKAESLSEIIKHRGIEGERIIGQYGIGFLAAFLIGDRIDVYSKRHDSQSASHWWCEGGEDFYIEPCEYKVDHGTRVVVTLKPNDALPPDFVDLDSLKSVCTEYASLLQVPVYVRGSLVNRCAPNWRTASSFSAMREEDMTDFLRERFPVEYLDTFRLQYKGESIKQGAISYRAALFIGQLSGTDFLLRGTAHEKSGKGIDVYVRGMFVTRTEDLMPPWASFVHGAIDVDNLNLSLSREDIRRDELLEEIQKTLATRVIERLRDLRGTEKLNRIIQTHTHELLLACLIYGDRKMTSDGTTFVDILSELLNFATTHGRMTLPHYFAQISDAAHRFRGCETDTIYCLNQKTSGAGESMLAEDMGWPVVFAYPLEQKVLESYVRQHPEKKLRLMQPDDFFSPTNSEERGRGDAALLRAMFEEHMRAMRLSDVQVRVQSFRASCPALLLIEGHNDPIGDDFFEFFEKHALDPKTNKETAQRIHAFAERFRTPESGRRILYINSENATIKSAVKLYRRAPASEVVYLVCRTVYNSAFLQSAYASLSIENARIVIDNFNETIRLVLDLTLRDDTNGDTGEGMPGPDTPSPPEPQSQPYVFLIHSFTEKPVLAAVEAVKSVLDGQKYELCALSADDEVRDLTVPENVRLLVKDCLFAVADITGNNPNVMIEIGMAEMLGKPVVKIRNENDTVRIPVDIGDDLYCQYQAHESERQSGKWDVGAAFVSRIPKHIDAALKKVGTGKGK
jgi:molecular chaperone HtpG